uniref:Serine/threonine-protein kinase RIO2 n=1 Tax=Noctiluca scintillans TaxID=2966 RepID=A0A7S1FJV0_NOCSC
MKLDVALFRYISKDEFRVLIAIEIGCRNHEFVPVPLIESIAKISRGSTFKLIQMCLRNKLVVHENKAYDGYRLSYLGYDFLALRTFIMRGSIIGVGRRLGVGKESDVHFAQGPNGEVLALKLHRLGRISFRNIKNSRDYLKHRQHASWQYMARLAAAKEYAYMKALADQGYPVPQPLDLNRHCVLMSYIEAVPMFHLRNVVGPEILIEKCFKLLVRLAKGGIIHGDFNEFNLLVSKDMDVTLIDFPQIVSFAHPNAEMYFDRDSISIVEFFRKRCNYEVEDPPTFKTVHSEIQANDEEEQQQVVVEGVGKDEDDLLLAAHGTGLEEFVDVASDEEAENDDTTRGNKSVEDSVADESGAVFEGLVPEEGISALGEDVVDDEKVEAQEDPVAEPVEKGGDGVPAADDEETESSESDVAPGEIKVSTGGRKVRRRATAQDARKNLQKQHKAKPAKANNQKVKDLRKAKHDVKEYMRDG